MKSLGPLTRAESTARISLVVYSSLTLLATAAAANAKGYLDSLGELTFVLLVAAAGLVVVSRSVPDAVGASPASGLIGC